MAAVARRDDTYVSNADYVAFLNAAAARDEHDLYDLHMSYNGLERRGEPGSYIYSVDSGKEDQPATYVSWLCAARYCNWLENNQASAVMNPDVTESGAYTLEGDRCAAVTETASHLLPETSDEVSFDQFPDVGCWGGPNFSLEETAFLFSETSGEVTSQTIDWSLRSANIGIRFKTAAASSSESGNAPRTWWDDAMIAAGVFTAVLVAVVWAHDHCTAHERRQGRLHDPSDQHHPLADLNNHGRQEAPADGEEGKRNHTAREENPADPQARRLDEINKELARHRGQKDGDEKELKGLEDRLNDDQVAVEIHRPDEYSAILDQPSVQHQIKALQDRIKEYDANIARLEVEKRGLVLVESGTSSSSEGPREDLDTRKARLANAHEVLKKREPLEVHWGNHRKLRDEIADEICKNTKVLSELKTLATLEDRVASEEEAFRSSGVTQSDLADAALQRQLRIATQAAEKIKEYYRDLKSKSTRLGNLEERLKDPHLSDAEHDDIKVEIHSLTKDLETIEGAFQKAVKSRDAALAEAFRLAAEDAKRREDELAELKTKKQTLSAIAEEKTKKAQESIWYSFTHRNRLKEVVHEAQDVGAALKKAEEDTNRMTLVQKGTERMSLEAHQALDPAEKEFSDALELRRIGEENRREIEWLHTLMSVDKAEAEVPHASDLLDYLSEKARAGEVRFNEALELLSKVEHDADTLFDSRALESYAGPREKLKKDAAAIAEALPLLEQELAEAKAMREILGRAKESASHFDPNTTHSHEELAAARHKFDEMIAGAKEEAVAKAASEMERLSREAKTAAGPAAHQYSAEANKKELHRLHAAYAEAEKAAESTVIESSHLLVELKKYAKQEEALHSDSNSSSSAKPPLQAAFDEVRMVIGTIQECVNEIAERKVRFFKMLETLASSDADHGATANGLRELDHDLGVIQRSLGDAVRNRDDAVGRGRTEAENLEPKQTTFFSSSADKETHDAQKTALNAVAERHVQAHGFMEKIAAHLSEVSERLRAIERNIIEGDGKSSRAAEDSSERDSKSETASDPSSERDAALVKRTKAFEYLTRTEEDICDFIDEFKRHGLLPRKRLENRLKKILKEDQ